VTSSGALGNSWPEEKTTAMIRFRDELLSRIRASSGE
jgi:hypothetical protein